MRDHLHAGEVMAALGLDKKLSTWGLWNRLSDDLEDNGSSEYGRWQGRLAASILQGVCKDHSLVIEDSLQPEVSEGILPPRGWKIAPNARTNGSSGVMIVGLRSQQQMHGWSAPGSIPEKARIRLEAIAVAYGVQHVYFGVLIDGYRSEVYQIEITEERRREIVTAVAEMIRMVREDDEPVVDYKIDKSAIRSGKTARAKSSADTIRDLIAERQRLQEQAAALESSARPHRDRVEEIETLMLQMLSSTDAVDADTHLISVQEDARGRRKLIVTPKTTAVNSLF